ncbi:hypothetical protein Ocin01_12439 [Orchesella cincta]|uniref:Uncharacterized protein n=1 Tax=Orchesella cincta TaxID=48709 RepID=A0A1D2MMT5_ORCCI|nr:hypothetical protein Ocin01_12439 [Orchesella cincta]
MHPNPCPCMSLQTGVKLVAVVHAVAHLLAIVIFTSGAIGLDLGIDAPTTNQFIQEVASNGKPMFSLVFFFYLNAVLLSIVLYFGAQKRNTGMCWAWLGFSAFHLVLALGIMNVIFVLRASDFVVVVVEIYLLFVVYAFIMQLRQQAREELSTVFALKTPAGAKAQLQGSIYWA